MRTPSIVWVGDFRDDISLSQPELDLLVSWVEGGAPEGDPIYLPRAASFPDPPVDASPARGLRLVSPYIVPASLTLVGIRPDGPLEVLAHLPDGSIRRLIWVRNFRPEWNRTYYFREPVKLPKGTRIVLYGSAATIESASR